MGYKTIVFSDESRQALAKGVEKLTACVSVTMGPKGRNVLIQKGKKSVLTKDGVSVAREIELKDKLEDMGAQLVKEVASNTADEAGDGTTTATVLANAIFSEGLRNITAGANPVEVKRGMDICTFKILENLKENSKEVTSSKEIEQVATISANSDKAIGKMIAEALEAVGRDGVVTVEESKGLSDSLDVVKGTQFNKGFLSPYFVTESIKAEAILEDAYILLYNSKIINLQEILPALSKSKTDNKPLLIICNDIEPEALNTLVINKMRGIMSVAVVRSPGFADGTEEHLKDIAVSTNANVINPIADLFFDDLTKDLGTCDKVIISKDDTTIIGGHDIKEEVQNRADVIKIHMEREKEPFFQNIFKERLAKLNGGVAVIQVSAPTETETKERKDRVDDALGATKAAQEEGIIIGGGCALIKSMFDVETLGLQGDQKIGAEIILRSITAPISQISENAGFNAGVVVDTVQKYDDSYTDKFTGFDASNGTYVNMFEAGIIDSLKVCRVALQNAVSVSSMLLTTECCIFEENTE